MLRDPNERFRATLAASGRFAELVKPWSEEVPSREAQFGPLRGPMREGTGRPGLLGVSISRSFPFVYHLISLPPGACAGTTSRSAQDEGHQQRGAQVSVTGTLWHAPHVLAHSPRVTARVCAGLTHMLVCHAADTSGKSSREALAAGQVGKAFVGGTGGVGSGCGGS